MTIRTSRELFILAAAAALLASAACSTGSATSSSAGASAGETSPVPVGYRYNQPAAKTNPDVVEETDAYYVTRYKKDRLVRMDESHVRFPFASLPVKLYREDADYYYIRTEKLTPEEVRASQARREAEKTKQKEREIQGLPSKAESTPAPGLTPADFATLAPPRASRSVLFARAGEGLPTKGQWRQNIAVADINGDGRPDIVATPARESPGGRFYVWFGDGKGNFRGGLADVVDASGKPIKPGVGYGGIAVADFNGDGRLDVATASHGGGLQAFLQRADGKFVVDDRGLPQHDFSSAAIVAFDANGDGKPDLVASLDTLETRELHSPDPHQVKVFVNDLAGKGWVYDDKALVGAFFSSHLARLGEADLLTGSNVLGASVLTWANDGKGHFSNAGFDALELYAYHQAVATGSFGKDRKPAIADGYYKFSGTALGQAAGVNVYYQEGGTWKKVPIWREKDFQGRITAVAMGDLDGDGLDDVVFPDRQHGRLRIFFQKADGTFEESPESAEPPLDSFVTDLHVVDLDGDGRPDIVLSKTIYSERHNDPGGIEVLLNKGRP